MTQFFRNNDLLEWIHTGDISVAAGSSGETTIFGTFFWNAQGTSQPAVTISQEEFGVTESVPEGYPRYFLRVLPASAPALSGTDRAFLEYKLVEDGDRAFQGAYGIFSFWCKTPLAKEIVVRCIRDLGTGGTTITGASTVEIGRQSFQLTNAWKKYEVKLRFEELAGATYGANSSIKLRIYLQGGSGELGGNGINWVNSLTDFAAFSFTRQAEKEFERARLSSDSSSFSSDTAITTIYATDSRYGAVGDYTGTGSTAGTGTDNRAAIQAALDAAYTQGPGGVNDFSNNTSYRVVIPKGKYYIAAPADGSPSLVVPLKVELDFSEAELHFDIPAKVGGVVPVAWCAIKVGQQGGVKVGKMQTVAGRDQTYGGTFYGMHLDGIRLCESDGAAYICGGGNEHNIHFFTRGACIRLIACWNTWIDNLQFTASCFGVVGSYYGNAFSSYTRYRDGSFESNNLLTSTYIRNCSFLGIHKRAILMGVKGDLTAFVNGLGGAGGTETFESAHGAIGLLSVDQCAFESIAENCVVTLGTMAMHVSHCMIETAGDNGAGTGVFWASQARGVSLSNIRFTNVGVSVLHASYTAASSSYVPTPDTFLHASITDQSPSLRDIHIFNNVSNNCKLVNCDTVGVPVARKPIVVNYKSETAITMQGTSTYLPVPIPNGGGSIYSPSTTGVGPDAGTLPNGARTVFTFSNGFTPLEPQWILADGIRKPKVNADASTNWSWNSGTGEVTMNVAPTKDIRAFY